MAIYAIEKFDLLCDECGAFVCKLRGPKDLFKLLQRTEVRCVACGAKPGVSEQVPDPS